MSLTRRIAARLLGVTARLLPADGRDWAAGMAAELDAIEGDWNALGWAVGGATAL